MSAKADSKGADYARKVEFFLNGRHVVLNEGDPLAQPHSTLLSYLRSPTVGLMGTKLVCGGRNTGTLPRPSILVAFRCLFYRFPLSMRSLFSCLYRGRMWCVYGYGISLGWSHQFSEASIGECMFVSSLRCRWYVMWRWRRSISILVISNAGSNVRWCWKRVLFCHFQII